MEFRLHLQVPYNAYITIMLGLYQEHDYYGIHIIKYLYLSKHNAL